MSVRRSAPTTRQVGRCWRRFRRRVDLPEPEGPVMRKRGRWLNGIWAWQAVQVRLCGLGCVWDEEWGVEREGPVRLKESQKGQVSGIFTWGLCLPKLDYLEI